MFHSSVGAEVAVGNLACITSGSMSVCVSSFRDFINASIFTARGACGIAFIRQFDTSVVSSSPQLRGRLKCSLAAPATRIFSASLVLAFNHLLYLFITAAMLND